MSKTKREHYNFKLQSEIDKSVFKLVCYKVTGEKKVYYGYYRRKDYGLAALKKLFRKKENEIVAARIYMQPYSNNTPFEILKTRKYQTQYNSVA